MDLLPIEVTEMPKRVPVAVPPKKKPKLKSDLQIVRAYVVKTMDKGFSENSTKRALYLKGWNTITVEHALKSVRQSKTLLEDLGNKVKSGEKITKPLRKYVEAAYDLGYTDKRVHELFWSLGFDEVKVAKVIDFVKNLENNAINRPLINQIIYSK